MEKWGPAILYLIGSGAIWKLIEFLVKRHDAKEAKRKELYRMLHVRLCEYKNEVYRILLEYYRTVYKLSDDIDEKHNQTDKYLAEINDHLAQIKKQERKCKKQKANDDVCVQCNQRRKQLPQLLETLRKEHDEASRLLAQCHCYWHDNEEYLYKSITKYLNLHNYLLAINIQDKKLYKIINDIDKQSLRILTSINKNKDNFYEVLVTLMESIEYALIMLSKKM